MWLVSPRLSFSSASELSDSLRRVLLALVQPDPGPIPKQVDSPLRAIARRVPELTPREIGDALDALEHSGWLDIPYIKGPVTPAETALPATWLTPEGWSALHLLQESE
ncbi:MAG TPA: hypothetical protein P5234_16445 [Thermoanaerobaculaceae bacterium]|nr:hypothetical protein [Thermoanaerobaculaceae bacterium]HRS17829.1 hypothetical protein [Thermoanaerobaculaceae bacterium]